MPHSLAETLLCCRLSFGCLFCVEPEAGIHFIPFAVRLFHRQASIRSTFHVAVRIRFRPHRRVCRRMRLLQSFVRCKKQFSSGPVEGIDFLDGGLLASTVTRKLAQHGRTCKQKLYSGIGMAIIMGSFSDCPPIDSAKRLVGK